MKKEKSTPGTSSKSDKGDSIMGITFPLIISSTTFLKSQIMNRPTFPAFENSTRYFFPPGIVNLINPFASEEIVLTMVVPS